MAFVASFVSSNRNKPTVAPPRGGEGGAAAPPPNVFQSVVLDSFKYDDLRRRGVGKLSADSVAYLACIYS